MTGQQCTEHVQEAVLPGSSFRCDQQVRTSHRRAEWQAPGCWHDFSLPCCRRNSCHQGSPGKGEDRDLSGSVAVRGEVPQAADWGASLAVHGTWQRRLRAESSVLSQWISWRELHVLRWWILSKDRATKVRMLLVQKKVCKYFCFLPRHTREPCANRFVFHLFESRGRGRNHEGEIYPCWPEDEHKSWLKSIFVEGKNCRREVSQWKNKFCRFYLN